MIGYPNVLKLGFIYTLVAICLWSCKPRYKSPPVALKGAIQITNVELDQMGKVPLVGEWKVHEGFFPKEEFGYGKVPGFWEDSNVSSLRDKGFGTATYSLFIQGLPPGEYSIKFHEIQNAYKVYMNGNLKMEFGNASENPESEIRKIGKPILNFVISDNLQGVALQLHISNWFEARGGIRRSPELGRAEFIKEADREQRNFDLITFGALFFFGFSSLFFYLITREETSPLFLSIACATLAIRILFTEEHYIYEFYPEFPPILEYRIDMGSLFVLVGVFFIYFYTLFGKVIPKKILYYGTIPNLVWLLGLGFFNGIALDIFFKIYLVYLLTLLSIVTFLTFLAIIKKQIGARVFLTSWVIFFTGGTNDVLSSLGILDTTYISPYTFLIFISSQSVLSSVRYRSLLILTEELNQELEIKFRAISASVQEAILVLDANGRILFGNEGALKIFGWNRESLVLRTIEGILSPKEKDRFAKGFISSIDQSNPKEGTLIKEFVGRRNNGNEFPMEISFTDWFVKEVRYFGIIIRDITTRKLLEIERDKALKTLQEDIFTAEKLQKGMYPTPNEKKFPFHWAVQYKPLSAIGGDLYDISIKENGEYQIFIADATGHGTQAALLTMAIKADYDTIEENLLPDEILYKLNAKIFPLFRNLNSLFTACVIQWNPKTRELRYASGGHPEQIVLTSSGLEKLSKTGPILSLLPEAKFKTISLQYNNPIRLVLFSDGVFEIFDSKQEKMFEEEAFHNFLLEEKNTSLENLIQKHKDNLVQFHGSDELDDDFTMIVIEL
ncbi:MAG: SpoIIE family protein phosphatase [Leptospiraceae bacterium]|nr:SpoIIE family protein phosphatase [Leptospiraceae bacterium]